MKKIIHRIILAVALLTATSALAADFEKGVKAYERGKYKAALRQFRALAEEGHAGAQFYLGLMYDEGEGVPENDIQAVFWFRQAAEQGDADAQLNLGFMYDNGEGVPENDIQAVFWFRQAAEQGDADAQFNLGVMFMDDNGESVPEDARQAVFWFRKAAGQGNAKAQFNLGFMYDNGEGIPEDDRQAVFWFRKAAEQGDAKAQFNLGVMYDNEDNIQAYAWFNLAAAQGDEDAEEARDDTRQHMTSSQIAEARKLSREIAARIERNQSGSDSSSFADDSDDPDIPLEPEPELEGNGSGFVIGRDGETTFIVTNYHVVEDCAKVSVVYAGKSYEASVRAKDVNSDIVLLETNIPSARPASFSSLSRARLGEAITAAGYLLQGLLSKSLNVTGGNISALAGLGDDAKHLQITAPLQPGNSGGPLLDASGNVVGVAASKLNAIAAAELTGDLPQNVNFAIKAALVRSFLDIHAVDYQRLPSETKLEPEQLAERARQFTVAVHCWK